MKKQGGTRILLSRMELSLPEDYRVDAETNDLEQLIYDIEADNSSWIAEQEAKVSYTIYLLQQKLKRLQ